jgi:glycolate oxidase FAD binding subunit
MNARLAPANLDGLVDAVRSCSHVLPVGGRTKPRLCEFDGAVLDMTRLNGITEYEPSEFTFTALAGTPLRDIAQALGESGQYLPFDPMLVRAGSTLGGTLASGLNGPGRFRYGGLRDFILGARFVDGTGRLLRMGGKVVKNAAGFDLPKFFVGSLGRFGVLAELTFKVFPRPASLMTLRIPVRDVGECARVMIEASRTRWEPDALDAVPSECAVYLRLGGPREANEAIAAEVFAKWPGEILPSAENWWADREEFRWAHSVGVLAKVPITPMQLTKLCDALHSIADCRVHVSAGANVAFVSLPATEAGAFDGRLRELALSGLTLRGEAPLKLGVWPVFELARRVKTVLDPDDRFPSL